MVSIRMNAAIGVISSKASPQPNDTAHRFRAVANTRSM